MTGLVPAKIGQALRFAGINETVSEKEIPDTEEAPGQQVDQTPPVSFGGQPTVGAAPSKPQAPPVGDMKSIINKLAGLKVVCVTLSTTASNKAEFNNQLKATVTAAKGADFAAAKAELDKLENLITKELSSASSQKQVQPDNYSRTFAEVEKIVKQLEASVAGLQDFDGESRQAEAALSIIRGRMKEIDQRKAGDPTGSLKALEDLKKAAEKEAKDAKTLYQQKLKEPDARVKLEIDEWDGPRVKVHPLSVPGLENLSREERKEVTRKIGDKIKAGQQQLEGLLEKPEVFLDVEPTAEDAANLMWYLRVVAEQKAGNAFAKGAITIPDKGNLIRGYFDRCAEIYNRMSSHMKDQQKQEGGSARGMDFYEGSTKDTDRLLPYGMKTMLLQSMKIEETGEERLYVKLETEGARLGFKPSKFYKGMIDPDEAFKDRPDAPTLPESREATPEDRVRTKEHGLNLVKAKIGKKDSGGLGKAYREDMPKKVLQVYETMIQAVSKINKNAGEVLKQGNYKQNIHEMVSNVKSAPRDAKINDLLNKFLALLDKMGYEEATSRVGGEVVLTTDDIKPKPMDTAKAIGLLNSEIAAVERCQHTDEPDHLETALNSAQRAITRVNLVPALTSDKGVQSTIQQLQAKLQPLSRLILALSGRTGSEKGDSEPQPMDVQKAAGLLNSHIAAVEKCQHTDELDHLQEVLDGAHRAVIHVKIVDELRNDKVVDSTVKLLESKLQPLARLIQTRRAEESVESE